MSTLSKEKLKDMKKILLLTILTLTTASSFGQITTDGLVANYTFNNGNANDEAGTNHGTVSGAVLTQDRFGNTNMAYSFHQDNQAQIIIPNDAAINFTNSSNFTIAFWMKINGDNLPATVPLGKSVIDGSWNGYSFVLNATDGGYTNGDGSFFFYTASGAMQDAGANSLVGNQIDEWIFVTGIYSGDAGMSGLLVNNVLQTDMGGVSGTINNSANLYLGGYPTNPYSNYFSGSIDDLRIYNRILTEEEVTALYNEANPVVPASIITLNCGSDQTINASSLVTTIPDVTTAATASTDCVSGGLVLSQLPIAGSALNDGANIITVTATDDCGTTITDEMTITFLNDLGIDDLQATASISLYPNPAENKLTIETNKPTNIFITNILGEQLFNSQIEQTTILDLSNFSSGIYFVKNEIGSVIKFEKK